MPISFVFYLIFGTELKTMGSYPLCLSEEGGNVLFTPEPIRFKIRDGKGFALC